MNSKTLFKQVRHLPKAQQPKPVSIHVNYHPGPHPAAEWLRTPLPCLSLSDTTKRTMLMPDCPCRQLFRANSVSILPCRQTRAPERHHEVLHRWRRARAREVPWRQRARNLTAHACMKNLAFAARSQRLRLLEKNRGRQNRSAPHCQCPDLGCGGAGWRPGIGISRRGHCCNIFRSHCCNI